MLNLSLSRLIGLALILLVSFPVHELAHAYMADYFGDDTPRLHGRLSLNPLVHLEFFGALSMLLVGFGWAKPVPVSEYALSQRSRYAPAIVALAGPAANLVLAILSGILLASGVFPLPQTVSSFLPSMYELLYMFSLFNFVLFFFNLIPLFPLDGEKIALSLLPYEWSVRLESLRRFTYGPLLIFIWLLPVLRLPILNWLIFNPSQWLVGLFSG